MNEAYQEKPPCRPRAFVGLDGHNLTIAVAVVITKLQKWAKAAKKKLEQAALERKAA